ncbi:hypothetical protein [Cellulosilyticum sp. I15G10I2]|uniref:hypothetical protein n=1 Tax=Cellulosilyticum sp. I15G10I2 TaxID=1892843 RepID=UPI00085CDD0F|nr:hypothetical protein [Cellulosilyticum sp. I15G10I2]
MKNLKKVVSRGVMILAVGVTSLTAYAASSYNTPAEALAGVTGKTVEGIVAERAETGKTYGAIADEAGKLTEFKSEVLEIKKDALAERVASGTMTQGKADEIIAALEKNQINCDGTGTARIGQNLGAGFGCGNGNGNGLGNGRGGAGRGNCGVVYQGQ